MIFGEAVHEAAENELADAVRHAGPFTISLPLPADRYVAMSALQKAVRRGREELALSAAANLLSGTVAGFWKRMIIIALEEICVADVALVSNVVVGASNGKLRAQLGGDWAVAEYLVRRMCRADADRSADDLVVLLEGDPALENQRGEFPSLSMIDRIARATNCPDLNVRALAAWFAVGTDKTPSVGLVEVSGCPDTYFDALYETTASGQSIEISRIAFRRTRCVLAPLLPLLYDVRRGCEGVIADDEMPEECLLGPVPSWVFDMHTRTGLSAFSHYARASTKMRDFIKSHYSGSMPVPRMIGHLVFRIESGLCAKRLKWEVGNKLRRQADLTRVGLDPTAVPEGLSILREEIGLVNACRAEAVPFYLR